MLLSKAEQFGEVVITKERDEEEISLEHIEKIDGMLFRFIFEVTIEVNQ